MTSVVQTPSSPTTTTTTTTATPLSPHHQRQHHQLPPLSPSSTSTPFRSPQSATSPSSSSFSARSLQSNFFRSTSKSTDSIDTDIDRNQSSSPTSSSIIDDCSQRTARLFQSIPWFNGRNSKSTSQLNLTNCDKSNMQCISFDIDNLQSPHDQRLKGLTATIKFSIYFLKTKQLIYSHPYSLFASHST